MYYPRLNATIKNKYAASFDGRALAFEYLDYYLRLLESSAGEDILLPALRSKRQGCYSRGFFYTLLLCWLEISPKPVRFVLFRTTTFSKKYACELLKTLARKGISAQGVLTNEAMGSAKLKFKYLLNQGAVFELFRRSMLFYCVLKNFNVVDSASMKYVLGSEAFLNQINRAIEVDYRNALKVLNKWQPFALVLNSDQTPESHMIVKAASALGIKTCVIAHGYFKNPWLVSVLPLYADRLYTWTDDVKQRVLNADQECNVYTLNGIKLDCIAVSKKAERKILVAGSPLYQYETAPEYLNAFKRAMMELGKVKESLDVEVVYKPHPLETNHVLLEEILSNNGIKKIGGDIYKLAAESLAVCGGLTSFLYEAAQSGIAVAQIKELSLFEPDEGFDGVPMCAAAELNSVLSRQLNAQGMREQSNAIQYRQDIEDFASWLDGREA